MTKEFPIITFLNEEDVNEPWEQYIVCQCHKCGIDFDQDTDDINLDEDEPLVICPHCKNERPLKIIKRKKDNVTNLKIVK